MVAVAMALHFLICPAGGHACEEGLTVARSCEQAERFLRAELRPHQTLHVTRCAPFDAARDWPRGG